MYLYHILILTIVCGIYELLQSLKVKNIIITKQAKHSEECQNILNLIRQEKINTKIVNAGNKVIIDKYVYFDILYPDNTLIMDNPLNNNSMLAKLVYFNFTMLFTGDIEEIAERNILEKYKTEILKSTILKISHHGSKTSSTEEFLENVNAKIALIGVGKNNKYGHPNDEVINRLKNLKCRIYRTDENGEINITVNKKGVISVKKFIKQIIGKK